MKNQIKQILLPVLIILINSTLTFSNIKWIGDFRINKHYFNSASDIISVKIKAQLDDYQNTGANGTVCKLIMTSVSKLKNDKFEVLEYDLNLSEFNQDSFYYTLLLPVTNLPRGRYILDIIVNQGGKVKSLSEFQQTPEPITIGESGFLNSSIEILKNGVSSKVEMFGDGIDNNFLPSYLEGVFTKGFCNNENVDLINSSLIFWTNKNVKDIKVKLFYNIDNSGFKFNDSYILMDNSKDGEFNTLNHIYKYIFYHDEEIADFEIKSPNIIDDLLSNITNIEGGLHHIDFYFEISLDNVSIRLPEENFISTSFKVVNSPIGADCQALLLPIDLIDWSAIKKDKSVYLQWSTASEVNNDYFEVMRSYDLEKWESIYKVGGKNKLEITKYSYLDNFPHYGENYYRLRQTDLNGQFKYSKFLIITNIENKLLLYPNPVGDKLFYEVTDPNRQFLIEIYNEAAQLMMSRIVPENRKTSSSMDVSKLASGLYIIKYLNLSNSQYQISKFVKE